MQFIEGLFGISPDSGSGLLELSFVAIIISIVVLPVVSKYYFRPKISHKRGHSR